MNLKPLHDNVILEMVGEEEKTRGGIIIPDTAKEKPSRAKVIAVGEGARDKEGKLKPMSVKVGDEVIFAKWTGSEVKVEDKIYMIVKESDVLAIVA
jgi:chaperonin GroES